MMTRRSPVAHVLRVLPRAPPLTCVSAGGGLVLASQVRSPREPRSIQLLAAANAQVGLLPDTNRQQDKNRETGPTRGSGRIDIATIL